MKRRMFFQLLSAMVLVVLIGAFLGAGIAYVLAPPHSVQTVRAAHGEWLWSILVALLLAVLASTLLARAWHRRLARILEATHRLAVDIPQVGSADFEKGGIGRRATGGDRSPSGNKVGEAARDEIAAVADALDKAAVRVAAMMRDLENSRKEMETALDSMEDAVITVNAQSRIHWTNRVMDRLSGAAIPPGSALVETVRDPDLLTSVTHVLGHRIPASTRAKAVVPGRIFEVSAAPMPGGGAVVVLHDVTEIDRVEKTRRDFIANVSHELRTPLTSISGYAETLLEDGEGLSPQAREFLSVIRRNASRMTRLSEDLLALARIESGEHKLNLRPVAASLLMEEAAVAMSGLFLERGIVLEQPETASAMVIADADAILQVLSNLLENAVKYGDGGRILLGSHVLDRYVEFYVRDFGAGIASEHLERIFERFYRIDKGRSRDSGGTGLGLSIVKHVVLAHGGTVRAESDLEQGSTFFFTLPVARSATLTG